MDAALAPVRNLPRRRLSRARPFLSSWLPVLIAVCMSTSGCAPLLSYAIQSAAEGSTVTPVGDGTLMVKYQGPLLDEKKWLEASRKACNGGEFTVLNQQPARNPDGIQSYIGQIRCKAQAGPEPAPAATDAGPKK
jgi:hypothetical protein